MRKPLHVRVGEEIDDIYHVFIGQPVPVILLLTFLACFLACTVVFGIHP